MDEIRPAGGVAESSLTTRRCGWCEVSLEGRSPAARFCSRKCRQSAFRLRRRSTRATASSAPGRFAYADPPYPGLAHYYRDHEDFGGEVDHAELIASLIDRDYTGWALSTSSAALREVLPLCPPGARVLSWVKPIGVPKTTYGLHSRWEPLIVVGGRKRRPGVRDWLRAMPARGGGDLIGRKPIAFCAWLFESLGMLPGDEFEDLFPGTGVVRRAWESVCSDTECRGCSDDTEAP